MPALTPSRRNRIILIVVVLAVLIWALYTARQALFPFAGGLIAGYIILPLVNFLDRHMVVALRSRKLSRSIAILIVYLLVILVIAIIVAFLIPVLDTQFRSLQDRLPYLIKRIGDLLAEWLGQYQASIPINIQQAVSDNAARLVAQIGQAVQQGISQTLTVVTTTISFIFGIAIIPVWLFYVLLDESRAKKMALAMVPRPQRTDAHNIYLIIDSVLGAYLRGQLLAGSSIGLLSTIALIIVGVDPALLIGIMAGILEMLPYIGPLLAIIVAVLVALLQSPAKALWTAVAFLIIQQVESNLLVPQISGRVVRLHPALIMVVLLIGNELAGFWGMLIAVPLTAMVRDVFRYLYLRFSDVEVSANEALTQVMGKRESNHELLLEAVQEEG